MRKDTRAPKRKARNLKTSLKPYARKAGAKGAEWLARKARA